MANQAQNPKSKNKITQFILDVLFPSFCVDCGKEGTFLCDDCRAKIVVKRVPQKPDSKSALSKIYAATDYNQRSVTGLITGLKFHSIADMKYPLTEILIHHLSLVNFQPLKNCVIMPVPLHKRREIKRGFNQAGLIAEEIAEFFKTPYCEDVLKRTKNTEPQTETLNHNQRLENIKNAFACRKPELVAGKRIIIVDDVMTTGATLNECARALKSAGARSITAFAVAN